MSILTFDDYKKSLKNEWGKIVTYTVLMLPRQQKVLQKIWCRYRKARIAGILHDITKEMPYDQQLKIMQDNGIMLDNVQQFSPKHGTQYQAASM